MPKIAIVALTDHCWLRFGLWLRFFDFLVLFASEALLVCRILGLMVTLIP